MTNENPYGSNPQDSPYAGGGSQSTGGDGQNQPYSQPDNKPGDNAPEYGQQAGGYQPAPGYQSAPQYDGSPYGGPPAVTEPPPSLLLAVKLMFVGAAISLVSVLTSLFMRNDMRKAVEEANNSSTGTKLTPDQIDTAVNIGMIVGILFGLIGVGLWILMALMNRKGKKWARIVATVLCVLSVLSFLGSLAQNTSTALSLIISALITLLGVVIVVLLWRKENSHYYEAQNAQRI